MANSVDPDQTAPIGTVCSGSTLFASILISSVMLGNYLQQTASAEHFQMLFFLGALRVNIFRNSKLFSFWIPDKHVLWQTVKSQMKCCLGSALFAKVKKSSARDRNI